MSKCSLSLQRTFAHYNMSPRNKRLRKVLNPPVIKGFKPYGPDVDENKTSVVILPFEEYEALRLCDYDMYNHHQASVIMGVSRPTFTRIYAAARQKIAKAFVEGSQISIEGGKVYFDSDWYHCKHCTCYFNNPEKNQAIENCPLCKSAEIVSYDLREDWADDHINRCEDICVCPDCGHEQAHEYGKPCGKQICPNCNARMTRKGSPGRGRKSKF
jgi:uncharacterized protein